MGGLARRASYIESFQRQKKNVLVLDAGNVFSSPGLHGQIKSEIALEGMQMMSYSMFNLGYKDFVHGLDFLSDYTDQFSVPTINANVVYEDTGENITEPYRIIKAGSLKVGFIGVVAKSYGDEIVDATSNHARKVTVLDEMTTLQTQIDAIKNEVDVIIVLASVGLKKSITIANEMEGIDVIICSEGKDIIDDYLFYNGVYIVKAGYDGTHIGNLTLNFNITKNIVTVDSTTVELDSSFPDHEDLEDLMDKYHERLEELKDELLNREQEDPDTGWYYAGSSTCSGCHTSQSSQWNTTAHADTFIVLIDKDQEYNMDCIFCHTTGWGYTGGFIISDTTPEMEEVQCEMCHGAGGEHIATGNLTFETISKVTCIKCHTEKTSPDFDYYSYYSAIGH